MTTYDIEMTFQPVKNAVEVLNTLCLETTMAIEENNLVGASCNMFIPVRKSVMVFTEVQMDTITRQPVFYVTSSKNKSATIQAMSYKQAVSKLQLLLG